MLCVCPIGYPAIHDRPVDHELYVFVEYVAQRLAAVA